MKQMTWKSSKTSLYCCCCCVTLEYLKYIRKVSKCIYCLLIFSADNKIAVMSLAHAQRFLNLISEINFECRVAPMKPRRNIKFIPRFYLKKSNVHQTNKLHLLTNVTQPCTIVVHVIISTNHDLSLIAAALQIAIVKTILNIRKLSKLCSSESSRLKTAWDISQ